MYFLHTSRGQSNNHSRITNKNRSLCFPCGINGLGRTQNEQTQVCVRERWPFPWKGNMMGTKANKARSRFDVGYCPFCSRSLTGPSHYLPAVDIYFSNFPCPTHKRGGFPASGISCFLNTASYIYSRSRALALFHSPTHHFVIVTPYKSSHHPMRAKMYKRISHCVFSVFCQFG